jgi:hypothetical protein
MEDSREILVIWLVVKVSKYGVCGDHRRVRRPFQADSGVRLGDGPCETFNVRLAAFVNPVERGTKGLTGARVSLKA